MAFIPRPAQQAVLDYTGGRMGVSAVPGSGKTYVLSHLAAQLVSRGLGDGQEVLVVTFANSAVHNFVTRIQSIMREKHTLLPYVDYRVRTLHGLAHDIVKERPSLAGLAEDFTIMDERIAGQMRDEAVSLWVREHPHALEPFLDPDVDEGNLRRILHRHWPELVFGIADKFIRRAKDLQLSPADLRQRLGAATDRQSVAHYPLLQMGVEIYEDYQRALAYRGGVDFDDLIRLALDVIQSDPDLLARLQFRWPYILEDEAQDSSYLQEKILRLLSRAGNWVRVGDPNQAINTTFTTANPHFLRQFLEEEGVKTHTLPNSGRSTLRIIELANYLVDWTCKDHPQSWIRQGEAAAFLQQHIEPTPAGDPQPNPTDEQGFVVHLHPERLQPDRELQIVVRSLARWLTEHQDWTVAVLVPINARGFKLAEMLKARGLRYEELLRSTSQTRQAASVLEAVLRFLADPLRPDQMARAFIVWDENANVGRNGSQVDAGSSERHTDKQDIPAAGDAQRAAEERRGQLARILRRCRETETFLYPGLGIDWSTTLDLGETLMSQLGAFREAGCRWLAASALPIDQLILTLAQELFHEPADLALAYKVALLLKAHIVQHPEKRLPELVQELALIANNQRRFLGFDDADLGYQPKEGVITVSTMHKAKGMEWDRVYLVGLNNYNFPSVEPHDYYRGESWFIHGGLNLEAEAIAQLEELHEKRLPDYVVGEATEKARIDYTAERLRLFYVGITRAKKELVVTWNSGHTSFKPKMAAVPFIALQTHWEQRNGQKSEE